MELTYIYALIDPNDNNIRYIGKTDEPDVRYNKHLFLAKNTNSNRHIYNWIRSLLKQNKLPIFEILDEVPKDNWQHWEKWWIACEREKIKALNMPELTNTSDGGEGWTKGKRRSIWTEERKNKMRKNKMRKHNKLQTIFMSKYKCDRNYNNFWKENKECKEYLLSVS